MISVDKEEFHYKYNEGCINQNSESLSVRLLGYVETFSLVSLLLIGVLLAWRLGDDNGFCLSFAT